MLVLLSVCQSNIYVVDYECLTRRTEKGTYYKRVLPMPSASTMGLEISHVNCLICKY